MIRGPWRYVIAIGLALLCAPLAAQETDQSAVEPQPIAEPGQASGTSNGDQGAAKDLVQSLDRIEATIRDLVAAERASQAQGSTDNETRDIEAQEGMAFWAQAMFWATIGTIFVAAIGVGYVRNTVLENRRIGQAQVRAYLSCKSATYMAGKDGLTITPIIVNDGESPALKTWFTAYIDVQIHTPELTTNSRSKNFDYSGPRISAGGSEEGEIYFNSPEHFGGREAAVIASGKGRFDVFISLHWTDVFGQDNSADFQLMAGTEPMAPKGAARSMRIHSLAAHGKPKA